MFRTNKNKIPHESLFYPSWGSPIKWRFDEHGKVKLAGILINRKASCCSGDNVKMALPDPTWPGMLLLPVLLPPLPAQPSSLLPLLPSSMSGQPPGQIHPRPFNACSPRIPVSHPHPHTSWAPQPFSHSVHHKHGSKVLAPHGLMPI